MTRLGVITAAHYSIQKFFFWLFYGLGVVLTLWPSQAELLSATVVQLQVFESLKGLNDAFG